MQTLYLDRQFSPVAVASANPGDRYHDAARGECRRLTAERLCMAAQRLGNESNALLALLAAIRGASLAGRYDGRSVRDWYGLVGLDYEEARREELAFARRVCPACGRVHYANGEYEGETLCGECWASAGVVAMAAGGE